MCLSATNEETEQGRSIRGELRRSDCENGNRFFLLAVHPNNQGRTHRGLKGLIILDRADLFHSQACMLPARKRRQTAVENISQDILHSPFLPPEGTGTCRNFT